MPAAVSVAIPDALTVFFNKRMLSTVCPSYAALRPGDMRGSVSPAAVHLASTCNQQGSIIH